MRIAHAVVLSALSGILLALAFPPYGMGFCAFVAFVPLLFLLDGRKPRSVFFWGWLSGVVFLGATLYWIALHPDLVWPVMALVVLVLAVFYALPFWLSSLAGVRVKTLFILTLPFTLAGVEWVRSFDEFAFPWMLVGNSQASYPSLIQFADITSVYGVSFWVVAVNVAVYAIIRHVKSYRRWAVLCLLFLVPFLYSRRVMNTDAATDGNSVRIACIQGNVLPEEKWRDGLEMWNINLYRSLSIEAATHSPDLIVWPETATPVYLADIATYRRMVRTLVDSIGIPVLTGMPSIDFSTGQTWNSAGLFIPHDRTVQRYDKLHLVPFGEAFPYDDVFTGLRKFDFGQANWDEGTDTVVYNAPGLPTFNAVICFESIFPDLVRTFVGKGSKFIVVITNDVWFGPVASPEQHAMISVLRAIETHRPVVRCANTGITMFIDCYGRVLDRTETCKRTYLVGEIVPGAGETFYARFGNLFGAGCFLVSLGCIIAYFISTRLRWHVD